MSTRIALALKTGGELPWKMIRWRLVRELGWTLDQVDALSPGDYNDYQLYVRGEKRYREMMEKK